MRRPRMLAIFTRSRRRKNGADGQVWICLTRGLGLLHDNLPEVDRAGLGESFRLFPIKSQQQRLNVRSDYNPGRF